MVGVAINRGQAWLIGVTLITHLMHYESLKFNSIPDDSISSSSVPVCWFLAIAFDRHFLCLIRCNSFYCVYLHSQTFVADFIYHKASQELFSGSFVDEFHLDSRPNLIDRKYVAFFINKSQSMTLDTRYKCERPLHVWIVHLLLKSVLSCRDMFRAVVPSLYCFS